MATLQRFYKTYDNRRRHLGQTCFGAGELDRYPAKGKRLGSGAEAAVESEFLLNAGHELRNTLHAIIGFNELILGTGLTELQRRYAELVHASSMSLLGLIESILARKLERGTEKQGETFLVNDGPSSAGNTEPSAVSFSILVADDNLLMRELVLTILRSTGCETETADNGQIALAKLEKADFDLIIMDNHMPVMTGVEAIKVIRSRKDGKRFVPILSLTADVTGGSREICASAGANLYMEKPFKVDSFLAAVTTLARYGRDMRLNGAA